MKNLFKMKKRIIATLVAMMLFATCFGSVIVADAATTIDFNTTTNPKTSSIVVHKYVTTSDVNPGSNDPTGTITDADQVEDGYYQELEGAEFMLFKIADAAAVEAYYNGKTETAYDIEEFVFDYENKTAKYDGNDVSAVVVKDAENNDVNVLKTNTSGICKFDNLPLGIYALVESAAPDYIAAPLSKPCLVSIPMVNTFTSDNANDWIYDVHVYPKNYDFATLELTKQDDNGKGLNGVTFKLYKKVIDADGTLATTWTPVTKGATNEVDADNKRIEKNLELVTSNISDGVDTTNDDGRLVLTGLTSGQYGTQYKLVEVSSVESYIVNKHPLYFTVNKDNTIAYNEKVTSVTSENYVDHKNDSDQVIGHDVVKDSKYVNNNHDVVGEPVSKVYPPTLTVVLKNARPYLEKKVKRNTTDTSYNDPSAPTVTPPTWVNSTEYNMGDTIQYQIIAYVPKNIDEINYTILDTPDYGLTDDISNISITYAELSEPVADWNATTISWSTDLAASTDYTLTEIDAEEPTTTTSGTGKGFSLSFNSKKAAGKYVKIVYDAYLNDNAVIADKGNGNKATITYSKVIGDPTDTNEFVLADEARVYTYEFEITKRLDNKTTTYNYDSSKGYVKFNLYKDDKDAETAMKLIQVTDEDGNVVDGVYRLPIPGEEGEAKAELVVGTDGTLTIQGLENGKYYLEEIDTIKGYNLLSERFEIVIANNATTTFATDTGYTTDGRTVREYTSTSYTTNQAGNATTVKADIINKKGFTLPQTGSMGYLLICVIGVVLIAGGATLMFSGRKKKIK